MPRKKVVKKPVKQFNNPMSRDGVTLALNWYYNNTSDKLHKGYMKEYLDKHKMLKGKKNLKGVNEYEVDPTYANVAKLVVDGYQLPDDYKNKMTQYATKFVYTLERVDEPEPKLETPKQQPIPILEKLLGESEYQIDNFIDNNCKTDFSLKGLLVVENVKQGIVNKIRMWYRKQLKELKLSIATGIENKDYRDAYGYLTKPQRKRFIKLLETFIEDCETYSIGKKKPRKPKRTKRGAETVATLEKHLQTL
jgi:hypothetical protein